MGRRHCGCSLDTRQHWDFRDSGSWPWQRRRIRSVCTASVCLFVDIPIDVGGVSVWTQAFNAEASNHAEFRVTSNNRFERSRGARRLLDRDDARRHRQIRQDDPQRFAIG